MFLIHCACFLFLFDHVSDHKRNISHMQQLLSIRLSFSGHTIYTELPTPFSEMGDKKVNNGGHLIKMGDKIKTPLKF